MKQTFNDIKKYAYDGDTNCCTVIATSIAFEQPFKEVQKYFFSLGRKRNKGFAIYQHLDKICKKYKYNYEKITLYNKYKVKDIFGVGLTPNNVADYLDLSTYLIGVNGHIFTLKNGIVEDWTRNRKHQIETIIRVEPIKKVKDLTISESKFDFTQF